MTKFNSHIIIKGSDETDRKQRKLTEGVTLSGIKGLFVDDTLENSITLIKLMDAEGAKPYLFAGNLSGKRTEQLRFT